MLRHLTGRVTGYERALRVIGRRLDSEPSYHASITEVPEGFTLRWHAVQHKSDAQMAVVTWAQVLNLGVLNSAARATGRKRRRHQGLWEHFPTGHEDFFRALGHVLDSESAANVSIDELQDGLSVVYARLAGDGTCDYERCHRMYGRDEVTMMLEEAVSRRGSAGSRGIA